MTAELGDRGVEIKRSVSLRDGGRVDEAETSLREVLVQDPNDVAALIALCHTLRQRGDHAGALAASEAAAVGAKIERSVSLRDVGRLDEAETGLREVLVQDPNNVAALIALCHTLRRRGDHAGALAASEAAAVAHSHHIGAKIERSVSLRDVGRLDEAETGLREVLVQDPNNVAALIALCHTLRRRGDHAGALAASEAAAVAHSHHIGAKIERSVSLRDVGRLDEAEAGFREVLGQDPNNFAALIALCHTLRHRGDHAGALAASEAAAVAHPDHIGAKIERSVSLRDVGRLDEAEAEFREVLVQEPNNIAALIALCHTLRQRGDHAGALAASGAAAIAHPHHIGAQIERSVSLRDIGRLNEAEAGFHEVLVQDPANVAALIALCHTLRQRGDHGGALAASEAAAVAHPHHIGAKIERAVSLRDVGRLDEAEAGCREVLVQDPANVAALIALCHTLRQRGDHGGALAASEAAAVAHPHHIGAKIERAVSLRDVGRLDEAEAGCREVLVQDPANVAALIALCHTLRQRGDHASALAASEAAAVAHPHHIGAQIERSVSLRDVGRLDEAEAGFRQVLVQDPNDVAALIALCHTLRQRGDHAGALAASEAAAVAHPHHIGAKIERAVSLRAVGRLDEAEACCREALVYDPDNIAALIALCHTLRQRGDHAGALAASEAAVAHPHHIGAKIERSVSLRDVGRLDEAEAGFRQVLVQDPNNIAALIALCHTLRQRGDHADALAASEAAAVAHPDQIGAKIERSVSLRAVGRLDEAEAGFREVLAKDPYHLGALEQIAEQAWVADNTQKSLEISLGVIKTNPQELWPYLKASRAAAEIENTKKACDILNEARVQCGDQPQIAAARIALFKQVRDWDTALGCVDEARAGAIGAFPVWEQSVGVLVETGEYEAAQQLIDARPAATRKEASRIAFFRGLLSEARCDLESTAANFHQALADNPNDTEVHWAGARIALKRLDPERCRTHLRAMVKLNAFGHLLNRHSSNISQTHIGQLIDEFALDTLLLEALKATVELPQAQQIMRLCDLVRENPDHTPSAIMLMIALRRGEHLSPGQSHSKLDSFIPARIIQFWDRLEPPEDILQIMDGWKSCNPSFEYLRFDNLAAAQFLKEHYPEELLRAFVRATEPAQKADLFRLAFLSARGGYYVDADDRCLAPIDSYVPPGGRFAASLEHYGTIGNNFIGATRKHPVINLALEWASRAINRGDRDTVWLSTGPGLLTRAFAKHVAGLNIAQLANENFIIMDVQKLNRHVGIGCPARYKKEHSWKPTREHHSASDLRGPRALKARLPTA